MVEAGLTVLREEGLAAVTMRRVATALDTGPASLYVYVQGRDELLGRMLDEVVAGVPLPEVPEAGDPRWRPRLAGALMDVVHALNAYPGIGRVVLGHIPTGPACVDFFDRVLGLLLAGGVPRQRAAWGCDLISLHIGAVTYEVSVAAPQDAPPDPLQAALDRRHEASGIEERLGALDPARHPHLAASAGELRTGSAQERLALGIEVLIEGLAPRTR
ncbi:TetR/AcrR family transcriptional regulator [Streptomyces sp. NPDC089919]|uniref:TetR/AcrR family transcriptional regulator n=1 Tax=Streptomyces sp. NPDC089919 TaxID=3155188 RepID=UPI00342CCECF